MDISIIKHDKCRLCGSKKVVRFLTLDGLPLTDNLLTKKELGTEFIFPLDLYVCEECFLVQTLHDVNVGEYYKDYLYSISFSEFARRFAELLAKRLVEKYGSAVELNVIDIGGGDGLQLEYFKKLGANVFCIEPSEYLSKISRGKGIDTASCLFTFDTVQRIPEKYLPANIVVSSYTFDHVSDPKDFLKAIRKIIDREKGVVVIEVHDFEKIRNRREYCLFQHEHTTYYTTATLQNVLASEHFVLLETEILTNQEKRGNSLLVVAAPEESIWAREAKNKISLNEYCKTSTYEKFGIEIKESLQKFRSYVEKRTNEGVVLAGFGAAGRGILSLAASEVSFPKIRCMFDNNRSIHSYYTPRSHVLIESPEKIEDFGVNEIIVFSYGYFGEIKNSLKGFIENGGKLTSLLEVI